MDAAPCLCISGTAEQQSQKQRILKPPGSQHPWPPRQRALETRRGHTQHHNRAGSQPVLESEPEGGGEGRAQKSWQPSAALRVPPTYALDGFPSWKPSTEIKPCLPPLLRPQEGRCSTPPVLPALHGKGKVDLGHPQNGRTSLLLQRLSPRTGRKATPPAPADAAAPRTPCTASLASPPALPPSFRASLSLHLSTQSLLPTSTRPPQAPTFLLPPGPLGVQLPCQLHGALCF